MPSALLVMDFQTGVVERFGSTEVVRKAREAVDAARARGFPVVFVRVGFRDGAPEVSPRNKSFSALGAEGGMGQGSPATQVVPELEPLGSDVVVVKRRVSAFTGSDLEVVLRSADVDHLVLAGIATSGVVLSTLREAADRDYQLTVLSDACLDRDPEVHRVLTEKVFPRQADVVTVAEWAAGLG
ncbi:MAG TPA: isochorismatase family cysteine hydrolase [Nocardioides sp.]|uniref:cysteine hydrolase family protein n=1 Tax=Nocardioides sp. TaxID=35761 RepID=UPI002F411CAA